MFWMHKSMREPILPSGLPHWKVNATDPGNTLDEKGKRSGWSHDSAGHEAIAGKPWKPVSQKE